MTNDNLLALKEITKEYKEFRLDPLDLSVPRERSPGVTSPRAQPILQELRDGLHEPIALRTIRELLRPSPASGNSGAGGRSDNRSNQ